MVWYCSIDCQKLDLSSHKRKCRDIASAQAATDAAFAPVKNLFETDEEGRPTNVLIDDALVYVVSV